ncbi:hypothetical protein GOP47_0010064 [Adiantum capillus-veneris]|uniref:YacP-like NYN domain protein n=1 Tax=Adiantum capillus-veneris TaxID=13818 RepID=A0A9D4UV68_ADICA|nr:hypothetical protein GOP47_0010064 [Adiantum capillus-veneris]
MSPADDCLRASFFSGIDITALVCFKHEHAVFICAAAFGDSQKPRPQPPRITSNVKFNLQFLRRIKEGRSGERPSTGYRRKKVERDPSILAEEEEKREFYDSNSFIEIEMRRPVLLVDGYNMCGYWSKLKKHFKKGDLEYARQILVDELVGFSALRGTKAVVVFDAADSGLPDHKESYLGVDMVFSASVTADTWIEREVGLLRKDGCPKIWVVTSDHLQQQCAHASGAFVWSCKFLVAAIKDAKKERDEIVREMTCYSTKGKLLEHNLNPEVCSALKKLKRQLQGETG